MRETNPRYLIDERIIRTIRMCLSMRDVCIPEPRMRMPQTKTTTMAAGELMGADFLGGW